MKTSLDYNDLVDYKILIHNSTYKKASVYLNNLNENIVTPGSKLKENLDQKKNAHLSVEEFIELIIRTKQPQIFAESSVCGDGSDWNQSELSILGDISIAVPVFVYDDGKHSYPVVHPNPIKATLMYTPGALLRNGLANTPADWDEVTIKNEINYKSYYQLYERRLLPVFFYVNMVAGFNKKMALVTVPGLGCGQFSGKFRGQLGSLFKKVLIDFLGNYSKQFPNIKVIYYDPYKECSNERLEINGISLFVRPLSEGNENKSQLCEPQMYEEENDDFSEYELFSLVAWDHVSWPGNDFYIGSRSTDDGVKAAASNSMTVMTGIKGRYNENTNAYNPPEKFSNWYKVIKENNIQIDVIDKLIVLPETFDK